MILQILYLPAQLLDLKLKLLSSQRRSHRLAFLRGLRCCLFWITVRYMRARRVSELAARWTAG